MSYPLRFILDPLGLASSVAVRARAWLYIDPCFPLPILQLGFSFSPFFSLRLAGEAFLLLIRITELLSSATPFPCDSSTFLRSRDGNPRRPPSSCPVFP